jgi:hypothetical protein
LAPVWLSLLKTTLAAQISDYKENQKFKSMAIDH